MKKTKWLWTQIGAESFVFFFIITIVLSTVFSHTYTYCTTLLITCTYKKKLALNFTIASHAFTFTKDVKSYSMKSLFPFHRHCLYYYNDLITGSNWLWFKLWCRGSFCPSRSWLWHHESFHHCACISQSACQFFTTAVLFQQVH